MTSRAMPEINLLPVATKENISGLSDCCRSDLWVNTKAKLGCNKQNELSSDFLFVVVSFCTFLTANELFMWYVNYYLYAGEVGE